MIITQLGPSLDSHNLQMFAWSGLRRFSNTTYIADQIIRRHRLLPNQHRNARKQAAQINFALSQAREYFDAARSASLATRPVQLYYGCMSLALAEILWKGDGRVSLDKLRASEGRHGLAISMNAEQEIQGLAVTDRLKAKLDSKGTFKVWKKFARNPPLAGNVKISRPGGTGETGKALLYAPRDEEGPPMPAEGISFLECIRNLPTFHSQIRSFGEISNLVRATLSREETFATNSRAHGVDEIMVHPYDLKKIESIRAEFLIPARMFEAITETPLASGFQFKFTFVRGDAGPSVSIPEGTTLSPQNTYLRPATTILNEFGYFYIALYIAGMFSRYFPDIWMRHLDEHSDFSLLVELICEDVLQRLPLLTLSELESCLYIRRD